MRKIGWVVLLSLICISLPWIASVVWENTGNFIGIGPRTLEHIVIALFGIFIGLIIWRNQIKIRVLPLLLLCFIFSSIAFSINRFETNKNEILSHSFDWPEYLPECENESNYDDLWDYMSNGCHYTVADFSRGIFNRTGILLIAVLATRIFARGIRFKRKGKMDHTIIDQEKE
ncbi:MAG: hypothetical protein QNK23_06190 [Crocinitomicaceae bacterium]|nr:hypothetical protein [Crocinitomicaceae bacterium]